MADYTNNSKYAGEVWIENEKEEGFKTAFLNALFRQWQGHSDDLQNPKFNADMVDGHHASYFEGLVNDVIRDKVENFYIGDSYFHDSKRYTIGIESIRLYPENENLQEIPNGLGTYDDLLNSITFPWNSSEEYTINNIAPSDNPSLYSIIKELYYQLQNDLNDKADNSEFSAFKTSQEEFNTKWENKLSNFNFTEDGIDASSVNGLRFFVVTQEQYEEDYDDDDKKNLHNVFIIKDAEDFPDPLHPVYDSNPDNAQWNKYYVFKIDYAEYDGETVKCLLYKLNDEAETEWKIIAPISNFVDNSYISSLIDDESFINKNLFENLMRTVDIPADSDLIQSLPISKYYDSEYISGAYFPTYSVRENDIVKDADKQIVKIVPYGDNKKFLDFSLNNDNNKNPFESLKNALMDKINDLSSSLSGFGSRLGEAETNIRTNSTNITNLSGGASGTLKQVETNISDLGIRVGELENHKVNKWQLSWPKYVVPGLVARVYSATNTDYYPGNTKTHPIKSRSAVFFNTNLSLAVFQFNFTHLHKSGDQGKWVLPNFNTTTTIRDKVQNKAHCCIFAPPIATVIQTSVYNPGNNYIRIKPASMNDGVTNDTDGLLEVFVRDAPKKSDKDGYDSKGRWQYVHFYGQVVYRLDNAETAGRLTQFNLTNFNSDFSNWWDVYSGSPIDYENWEY